VNYFAQEMTRSERRVGESVMKDVKDKLRICWESGVDEMEFILSSVHSLFI